MREWKVSSPPDGESLAALTFRLTSWVAEVARGGVPLVCIAHAGVMRGLRVLGEGVPWEHAMGRAIPHASWERIPIGA